MGNSTESGLVSIVDVLSIMMWTEFYRITGVHIIENNRLCQDNESTILLVKDGCMSVGKNSNHIKNQCFLITDKVAQGNLKIIRKRSEEIWANTNTKSFQGEICRLFRSMFIGIPVDYDDDRG